MAKMDLVQSLVMLVRGKAKGPFDFLSKSIRLDNRVTKIVGSVTVHGSIWEFMHGLRGNCSGRKHSCSHS